MDEANRAPLLIPTLIDNKNDSKITQKIFELSLDKKKYELIVSLLKKENEKDNTFIFQLKEKEPDNIQQIIYFEKNKKQQELMQLFHINIDKCSPNPENFIFEIIEKYYNKNNIRLTKDKNDNSINVIFILKINEEELEIKIELDKKQINISNEKIFNILNKNIIDLKIELKETKEILKDKENEINILNKKIKELEETKTKLKDKENEINNLTKKIKELEEKEIYEIKKDIIQIKEKFDKKIIHEEKQFICKVYPTSIDKFITINNKIDGKNGINDILEVYHLHNDENSVYIASKNIPNILIFKIIALDAIYPVGELSGHNKRIIFIKYFFSHKENKDYLLSSDEDNKIIIWIIKDEINYEKINILNANYGTAIFANQRIYNALLIFTEKKNYIYTTTYTNDCSRLYELEDGTFIKDISITNNCKTLYVMKYKNLIIECCNDFIIIFNPFLEEIYDKIENEKTKGDNRHACITYNRNNIDYLNIINENGFIIIYDLTNKIINKSLKINSELYNIIDWNYNYLIFSQYNKDYLGILNLNNKPIEKNIKCEKNIICIKNIILNKNEELIIAAGDYSSNIYIFYSSLRNSNKILNDLTIK